MIEKTDVSGRVLSVDIRTGPDSGSAQYMSYQVVVETDEGTWTISGCHDLSPECGRRPPRPALPEEAQT